MTRIHQEKDPLLKIQHLRGNLYAIRGKSISLPNGQSMRMSNSIFINDTIKAIIDPSSNHLILEAIKKQSRIDWCFYSHSHFDHIYSCGLFPDATHFVHQDDMQLSNFMKESMQLPNETSVNVLEQWFQPHNRFKDGDNFDIGDTTIRVIHAPGHTRGHSCFYFPNERILFSADFDLSVVGPWYGQVDSSIDAFVNTAERLRTVEADLWVTGHLRWIVHNNIIDEIDRFMRRIEERDSRIISCLHNSRSVEDMSELGLIIPSLILNNNPYMRESEKLMITMHLERLHMCNKVQRTKGGLWKRVKAEDR